MIVEKFSDLFKKTVKPVAEKCEKCEQFIFLLKEEFLKNIDCQISYEYYETVNNLYITLETKEFIIKGHHIGNTKYKETYPDFRRLLDFIEEYAEFAIYPTYDKFNGGTKLALKFALFNTIDECLENLTIITNSKKYNL